MRRRTIRRWSNSFLTEPDMKNLLVALGVAAGGLLAFPVAMAADAASAPGGGEAMHACKADVEKLCPGVKPGEGRIKQCLKEHRHDVSPECKKAIAEARKQRKG
jgi:hypothetical protein